MNFVFSRKILRFLSVGLIGLLTVLAVFNFTMSPSRSAGLYYGRFSYKGTIESLYPQPNDVYLNGGAMPPPGFNIGSSFSGSFDAVLGNNVAQPPVSNFTLNSETLSQQCCVPAYPTSFNGTVQGDSSNSLLGRITLSIPTQQANFIDSNGNPILGSQAQATLSVGGRFSAITANLVFQAVSEHTTVTLEAVSGSPFPAPTPTPTPTPTPSTTNHYTSQQKSQFLNLSNGEHNIAESLGTFFLFNPTLGDLTKDASGAKEFVSDHANSFLTNLALEKIFQRKFDLQVASPASVSGALAVFAGLSTLVAPPLAPILEAGSLGFSVLGTLIEFESQLDKLRSLDPPDPNFTEIVKPAVSSIPNFPFIATDNKVQPLTNAFNALIDNLLNSVAVSYALQTSLNRADGAAFAGNNFFEQQQLSAANSYSLQLGNLLAAQPDLFGKLASAYKATPGFSVPKQSVVVKNVLAAQNTLRTKGFSPQLIQLFANLNVDSATQQLVYQDLLALDPKEIAAIGRKFADSLDDPSFVVSLKSASQELNQGVQRK